ISPPSAAAAAFTVCVSRPRPPLLRYCRSVSLEAMATKEEDTEEVMFENKFTRYRKGALVGTKSGFAFIVYPMPSVGYFDDPLVARRDQASALGAEGKGKMGKAYMSQKKGVKAGGRARGRGAK
ncbi:Os02g0825650, partial [Oryza sativa Japonica Group]